MLIKRVFSGILITILLCTPAFAAKNTNATAKINNEINMYTLPEEVSFTTKEDYIRNDEVIIPANSTVTAKICEAQREKRWHKSGFFICKVLNYKPADSETAVDTTNSDIYFIARKYEPIDGKDAAILSSEIVLTQAASIVGSCFIFFAPVDIAYFFTKGAIQREKHDNWFKAGVFNAYDNSIFWFWLKGKPIDLQEGDDIKVKHIKKEKAEKITAKILKKKEKQALKYEKLQEKETKRLDKYEKKCLKKDKKLSKKIADKKKSAQSI